jgi:hypothetical protein
MKTLRMVLSLALMVPARTMLGGFSALEKCIWANQEVLNAFRELAIQRRQPG